MSRGQWKDFLVEIRKSLNRYLSILFMVALGTAFFAGLRSSEPDMKTSLDTYLDDTGYMNIRVISTMGLTDADVTAIGAVRGVTDAEGVYTVDVLSMLDDSKKVIHVQSITGEINKLQLSEGRMPQAPDECVADQRLCETYGLAVGDRITVFSGNDEELLDSLCVDTFIITGIGISPEYLTFDRGTAEIGTGSVAGFIAVDKSAFTAPAYSQVYVCAESLDEYNCFSDEYANQVEELIGRIEAIAGERCEIRLAELTEDARQQVADAKEELAQGREEADREFSDAWDQITEGKETIREGWDELNHSQAQLEEGIADYEAGTRTLYENMAAVEDGERQIADAKALLEQKEAELNAARAAVSAGWEQYNAGLAELETAREQIEQGEEQLAALEQAMEIAEAAYAEGENQLAAQKAAHESAQAILDAEKAASEAEGIPWQDVPDLAERQRQLDIEAVVISYAEEQLVPLKTYMEQARAKVEESRSQLEAGKAEYASGLAQLEAAKAQLEASETQISDGAGAIYVARTELEAREEELADARDALEAGQKELGSAYTTIQNAQEQIDEGSRQLTEGEQELEDSITEYENARTETDRKFADAEAEIADAERQLAEVKLPEWYVLDRNTVQNYVEYDLDAQKIGALATVFPILFFFVAALVSLTTMTRMVEEQRTIIGTMKALGYSNGSIAMKYILYALSATLAGSVAGVLVGSKLLPWVVITAYGILYENMPVVATPLQPGYALIATAMAIVSTVGATWMACCRALLDQPASLMRPVTPAKGKRILLERLTFIWKHLNFSIKSTLRNLFRYKKRLFMTLFGIGACMALLLVGFGIKDSIETIVNRQYHTIWTYDLAVYLNDSHNSEEMEQLDGYLKQCSQVKDWMDISNLTLDGEANGAFKSVNLMIPSDVDRMSEYVVLKNRTTGEEFTLDGDTVLISEKLAAKLSLSVGDTLTLKEDEANRYQVTVGGIVENYLYYYVYLSPAAYEKVFGKAPQWNQRFILYQDGGNIGEEEEKVISGLLELDGATSIISSSDMRETISTMLRALDYVVLLLIGAAGLLAFVVLYNLNNINITERRRELATIKLLGFYPGELAAYVYRENVLLTIIGIGVGVLMGKWLTMYVIETVEIDMIMFGRTISASSYLYSILITALFSILVNVVMYYRLQKIDMIESLKSVE